MTNIQTTDFLNNVISKAINLNASDIHLEPLKEHLQIRYRLDGLLQDQQKLSKSNHASIISRVKVLVNIDIAEKRLPQDGRTTFGQVDLRVSIIPTIHGEKAVLRLLNREQLNLKLEDLGMEKEDLVIYQKMIARKAGIILVTGPTGSGKTTTLYTTLATINSKEVNITTIEDPVEYQLAGINQIQINQKAGLTFARGLRSILRQDPDIIMVGEIRDLETAKIALQAALTGHLVFSTLHTNDAQSSVTRLVDMGIDRYLLKDSLIGVVAQRLVRKIKEGRTGIFEVMPGLEPQAIQRTLKTNAKAKIDQGITTFAEIARVLYLESD
ncbi:MAG: GspE/PulE family protein [bacterium]